MKKKYLALVILIVAILGLLLVSHYSSSNNVSIQNHSFTIPEGYSVKNSSSNVVLISNGTNELFIEYHKKGVTMDGNSDEYLERFENTTSANITTENLTTKAGNNFVKTFNVQKSSNNKTNETTRYWFDVGSSTYSINCRKLDAGTEQIMEEIIDSMN